MRMTEKPCHCEDSPFRRGRSNPEGNEKRRDFFTSFAMTEEMDSHLRENDRRSRMIKKYDELIKY